jgi:hypothetical protein
MFLSASSLILLDGRRTMMAFGDDVVCVIAIVVVPEVNVRCCPC